MAHRIADRVRDTSVSTGTGTITLGNVPPKTYITVASIPSIANGDTVDLCIQHTGLNEWEVVRATYIGSHQFTRADSDVYAGSAGAGTRVNFSAGSKIVFCVSPARFYSGIAKTALSYWRTDSTGKFGEERSAAQMSGDITMVQSGAGAVARSLEARGRELASMADYTANTFAAALTGTGKTIPFLTPDDGGSYWPGPLIVDPDRQMTAAQRGRAPLFVWSNPAAADLVAGYNSGAQIWVGDNPTATPGAGDAVGLTIAVLNGNDRGVLWGVNIVVGRSPAGAGYIDHNAVGIEVNMFNDYALAETNPYGGSSGRKNMLELVASSAAHRLTSVAMIWADNDSGDAWFEHGFNFSRIVQDGIKFHKDAGGHVDGIDAFQVAAIYDASDSKAVIKVDGDHEEIFDLSGNPTFVAFVLGKNNAGTDLYITNNADFAVNLFINSGNTSAQQSALSFNDRGNGKWALVKDGANNFSIQNLALATTPMAINGATNAVTFVGTIAASNFAGTTYTPTLTGVANVDSTSAFVCYYLRVGTTVHVAGLMNVDPTANATPTKVGISLPVASALTAITQVAGTIESAGGAHGYIAADATNDRAEVTFTSVGTTSDTLVFNFSYTVL